MANSFKQLSLTEPLPYPTVHDLPSTAVILLTNDTINDRLSTLPADVYAMCKLATEIKQSVLHLQCNLEQYRYYALRLMSLIRCIVYNFGINCYYYTKLVGCMRSCNGKWKNLLFKTIKSVSLGKKVEEMFLYKAERNNYYLAMMRTINTNIRKIINKMSSRESIHPKIKRFLKSNGLRRHYERAHAKIKQILAQKEEQTYPKILLINQFIKYLLSFLHFCTSEEQELQIFNHFYTMVISLCRILRKFYGQTISGFISESLALIYEGLDAFISIFQDRPAYTIKVEQTKSIVDLITNKRTISPSKMVNQNSFGLRILIRILFNWKKMYANAQKRMSLHHFKEAQQPILTKHIRVEKYKSIKDRLFDPNLSHAKHEVVKISKSLANLNRRKSLSQNHFSTNAKMSRNSGLQLISNIKIQKQIEGKANQYFTRVNSLHLPRSCSKERKPQISRGRTESEEKQLKLEDYSTLYNNKIRAVATTSKIQLYKPEKMMNYYRKNPNQKLRLK